MSRIDIARELKDLRLYDTIFRDDWRFVCDAAFESLLVEWGVDRDRITPQAQLSEHAPECKVGQRFIVCTEAREADTQRQLRGHEFSSFGLFSQVVPRLAGGLPPRYAPKGDRAVELEYAILCLGRCGSTLVCRELAAAGCGRPIEHFRPPVQALLRNRADAHFEFPRWWDLVREGHTVNGVFATKLLYKYWTDTAALLMPDERTRILDFLVRAPIVHIERTDKAAHAVSQFVARSTGVWHLWKGISREDYEARSRAIELDLDLLVEVYLALEADETALKSMIADLGVTPITLDFDDLVESPKEAIAAVVGRLGRDLPGKYMDAPLALQSTTSDVHRKFRDRLQEELDRRAIPA